MELPKKLEKFLKKKDYKSFRDLSEVIQENLKKLIFPDNGVIEIQLFNNYFEIHQKIPKFAFNITIPSRDYDSMIGIQYIVFLYCLSKGSAERYNTKKFINECMGMAGFGGITKSFINNYYSGSNGYNYLEPYDRGSKLKLKLKIRFVDKVFNKK
jgi:hypothetical protein